MLVVPSGSSKTGTGDGIAVGGVGFTLLAASRLGSTAAALALALVDLAMLVLVARFARRNWARHGSVRATVGELWREAREGITRFFLPDRRN